MKYRQGVPASFEDLREVEKVDLMYNLHLADLFPVWYNGCVEPILQTLQVPTFATVCNDATAFVRRLVETWFEEDKKKAWLPKEMKEIIHDFIFIRPDIHPILYRGLEIFDCGTCKYFAAESFAKFANYAFCCRRCIETGYGGVRLLGNTGVLFYSEAAGLHQVWRTMVAQFDPVGSYSEVRMIPNMEVKNPSYPICGREFVEAGVYEPRVVPSKKRKNCSGKCLEPTYYATYYWFMELDDCKKEKSELQEELEELEEEEEAGEETPELPKAMHNSRCWDVGCEGCAGCEKFTCYERDCDGTCGNQ